MKSIFRLSMASLAFSLSLNAATLDECQSAYQAGAMDRAGALCARAAKENPKSYDANYFLALTYLKKGEYKKMLPVAQKLEKLAKTTEEYYYAYNLLGLCHGNLGNQKEELKYKQKELDMAIKSGNGENIAAAQSNIGMYHHYRLNDYDKALSYYLEATKNATKKASLSAVYNNISTVYQSQGKYNESIDAGLKALKLAEEAGQYLAAAYASINIGATYIKTKDYENSEKYIRAGLEIAKREGAKDIEASGIRSLGWLAYAKGDLNLAKKYALDALSLAKSIGSALEVQGAEYLLQQIK